MIRDRNIVCLASNWFAHPTSKQHVMRLLAEHNDVVWVNFHASRRPQLSTGDAAVAWRRLTQIAGRRVQRVLPRLQVLSPLLVPWPELPAARALNTRLLTWQIRSVLRRLPARPTQLWLFTPDVPELIPALHAECTVYYCVDEFAAFAGVNTRLVEQLERRTVAAADVVIATSQPLYDRLSPQHPHVHLVPHGVDFRHFAAARDSRTALPADVADLPHPMLGYFGLISDYVDLELLAEVARRRPVWSFVLLGECRRDTACLRGVPNVRLLGPRPYAELPAYCRAFDVGLIPFRMGRLVRAVNPIKLREYLAAGLPVVSSPMPEVAAYYPVVRTAETADEFIAATEAALIDARETAAAARQALVAEESWTARLAQLAGLITTQPARPRAKCRGTPAMATVRR